MLTKIDSKEIMTKHEACKKYNTKYIRMIITETVDQQSQDRGYVVYTADNEREFLELEVPVLEEYDGHIVAFLEGGLAEPYPSLGNVVYYD